MKKRFQKSDITISSGKMRNRTDVNELPGAFLGRLWALFGPPDAIGDEGFTYVIQDTDSGLVFTAYSGASGPAYGGLPRDREALAPVLDAFDALIDATNPVDCRLEVENEFGRYVLGVVNGQPFERPVAATPNVKFPVDTHAILEDSTRHPGDYFDALMKLVRAGPDDATFTALWVRTFDAIERHIQQVEAPLTGHLRFDVETLRDVALENLRELAETTSAIRFEAYAARYRAIRERAGRLLEQR